MTEAHQIDQPLAVGSHEGLAGCRTERVGCCTLHLADYRDVLPTLQGVTAIVADPPYGNDYRQKRSRDKLVKPDTTHAPIVGNAEPFDPRPLLQAAPVVVLWGANYYADKLPANGKWLVREFERVAAYPQTKIPMADIVRLCVALPRRISELCAAEWGNYEGGVLTLVDTKHPRMPRREQVPVPPQARGILETLPKIDALLLPYKAESVCSAFARACERLNIDDLHLHDLRHEGICRLFERGLNIPEVSMVSGHLSWATLKRYTHT